jgi:hypothetical protein
MGSKRGLRLADRDDAGVVEDADGVGVGDRIDRNQLLRVRAVILRGARYGTAKSRR